MTGGINNYKSAISSTPNTKSSTSGSSSSSSASSADSSTGAKLTSSTISQDQFLNLLVKQLQNQDPLNPMDNQQFAVQLATFSQLEQLVQLNKKLGGNTANGASAMASYLGNEVAYGDNMVRVASGKGSNVTVDVPAGTQSLRLDLLDAEGTVLSTMNYEGNVSAGQQVLALDNINLPDGKYTPRVVSVSSSGRFVTLDAKATGTVSGFVMEPEPKLLVDGEELAIADVGAVYKGN